MKYVMILAMLFSVGVFAADNTEADNQEANDVEKSSAPQLTIDDFQNFFIGVVEMHGQKRVVTLDIQKVDSLDRQYQFAYVMNSQYDLEQGEGNVNPSENLIQFDRLDTGTIHHNDEGKLILESVKKDSLNYWKFEEN